jgi:iron complex outermembrane receptor protein
MNLGDDMRASSLRRCAIDCGWLLASILIGSVANGQNSSPAAAPASSGLEEIVVTSQRREERLQDVPISVSAFTQEKMDAQGIRNVDDLTALTPGVNFERMGLSAASNYNDENSDISIRGIDSSAGASTTAIYIDDTPIQSRHIGFGTVNAFPLLFDLERVEVLRGPQGTLFGASAEGGAVRFVTPEPSVHTDSGYLRTELADTDGGDESYEAGAAFGGPIVDGTLGFRVSAYFRRDGGYVDRANYRNGDITESDANWQDTAVLRAALKWVVNDAVSITPSILYQKLHQNDTSAYWPELSNRQDGVFLNGNAQRNPSTDPFTLSAIKLDADISSSTHLIANLSYFSRDQFDTPDYTQFDRAVYGLDPRAPYGQFGESPFTDTQHNTTFEARLQSTDPNAVLTWTTGVYFAHLDENSTQFIFDPTINGDFTAAYGVPLCTAAAPCPGGQIASGPENRIIDKQAAIFGELTVKMGEAWSATAGLRAARMQVSGESIAYGPFSGPTVGPNDPLVAAASSTQDPVTPRAVLSYHPNSDNMIYASAAKGYRPGGINGSLGNVCDTSLRTIGLTAGPTSFSQDSLWSYELGSKNTLFDRHLQIDASLFVIDWKGIQQNVYLLACGLQFTANLGAARSQGGDVHVALKPVDKLVLDFTAAYTDAKYTETVCGGSLACTGSNATAKPIVSEGDRLPDAPWTFIVSGEYGLPSFRERDPYIRLDYRYTTEQTALLAGQDPNNGVADTTLPGLPRTSSLGMRAGLRWSGIDVSLYGQNLTNTHPLLFESRDTTAENLYFARSTRPRTIGVTLSYRY